MGYQLQWSLLLLSQKGSILTFVFDNATEVCMYVYIYEYIYIYIYTYIHIFKYSCMYMYICMYTGFFYMNIHICIYFYTNLCICKSIRLNECMNIHISMKISFYKYINVCDGLCKFLPIRSSQSSDCLNDYGIITLHIYTYIYIYIYSNVNRNRAIATKLAIERVNLSILGVHTNLYIHVYVYSYLAHQDPKAVRPAFKNILTINYPHI
jgi:hypothetical protein